MNETEIYYNLQGAADRMNVSRQYVYQLYQAGKFPNAVKQSKQIRIPASDIINVAREKALELKQEAARWEAVVA